MPDYTAPPGANDVELLLKSAANWPEGDDATPKVLYAREQAAIGAAGAWAEFERRTGWVPFLKDATAVTRYFDATDGHGLLDLNAGLLELTSVAVNGQAYTQDTQFWLRKSNAVASREPWDTVQFTNSIYGGAVQGIGLYNRPNQIVITGKWGYASTVPADVWMAVLRYGAAMTLGQIEQQQSIGSISQDGFSKSYDIVGIQTQKDLSVEWTKDFGSCVLRYTRVIC